MGKYSKKIGYIPDDWDFADARTCLLLESGMRPKEHVTDIDTDVPSLGGENIDEKGFLVFDNVRYIDPNYYQKMTKGHIHDDDIFINKDGANTGKIAYCKKKPFHECAVNEHVFLIRNKGAFIQQFLFYCLLSNIGNRQILKKIIGSAQEGINNSFIKGIILPQPSLPEQESIAKILSTVDEAIRCTNETIQKLERVKKSLMQNLLSGKMKPDGTMRTSAEFYEDEKMGLVPKGWRSVKLKEVAEIQRGKFGHRPRNDERFYNGEYPFVQTSDVVNSIFYLKGASQSLNELGKSVSRSFPKRTIIMTIAANIGFVAITEYEVYFPDSLIGINANEDIIDAEFLMLSLMGYKNILDAQATESAQKNINYSNLWPLLIMFPSDKKEQKLIVQTIKNIYKQIDSKQEKTIALEHLKKSLMQQLLTGKVRVDVEKVMEVVKG